MDKLKDVMKKEIYHVTSEDNVFEVAVLMKEQGVTFVPIVEDGKIKGIITERDIVIHNVAEKKPNSNKVIELMAEEFVSGTPDMATSKAANIMIDAGLSQLPVLEKKEMVGFVSLKDILK